MCYFYKYCTSNSHETSASSRSRYRIGTVGSLDFSTVAAILKTWTSWGYGTPTWDLMFPSTYWSITGSVYSSSSVRYAEDEPVLTNRVTGNPPNRVGVPIGGGRARARPGPLHDKNIRLLLAIFLIKC